MALIRFAEGQQRSGSIGASVYSHNRFGQYIRARSIPVNPNSDRQAAIRAQFAALAAYWNINLDQVERDAWDIYAASTNWTNKFGETVKLTGFNHFVRSNQIRALVGEGILDAAPVDFNLGEAPVDTLATADVSTNTLEVAFDNTAPWAGELDGHLVIALGIPQNASRTFFRGPWRYVGSVPGAVVPPTSPASFANLNLIWPFAVGQRLWLAASVLRADGRLSLRVTDSFLATA